jgi:2-keto-4-pentenoate hydratase/2-oxohepta-3-ene-1,7-dioic acid hydratase in catechol pathway
MKLANYSRNGGSNGIALVKGGLAYDIREKNVPDDIRAKLEYITCVDDLISDGNALKSLRDGGEDKIYASAIPQKIEDLRFHPPVLHPRKIFLAAVNYHSHAKEMDVPAPSEPYFFSKFQNALIGDRDPILVPRISKKVDWEVELAVVIGKRGKYVAREKARDYVAGYTVANDISFRDMQFPERRSSKLNALGPNWIKAKGLDNSFPLGPWLVTANELKDPNDLDISLSVNGEIKQKSNTSEMVFKVDQMVEYLSSGVTLEPGDVISTGTPPGVGASTGGPFLKDGDIAEASIEGIGVLQNPVKSES